MNVRALRRLQNALPNDVQTVVANLTIRDLDSFRVYLLKTTATVTLPLTTGSGKQYTFSVLTISTNFVIQGSASTELMMGGVYVGVTTNTTGKWFNPNNSSNYICTLDGSNTGGAVAGDVVRFTDVAAKKWLVEGMVSGATPATPFSG